MRAASAFGWGKQLAKMQKQVVRRITLLGLAVCSGVGYDGRPCSTGVASLLSLCRCAFVMLGLLVGAVPARGEVKVEHWTAASDTASSITGNVIFSPEKIIFQNGTSLSLEMVGKVPNFSVDSGVSKTATIYRITKPDNPRLLRKNHICGGVNVASPITYIAIWVPEKLPADHDPRVMVAFRGKNMPISDEDPGYCGGFSYDAAF